MERDAPRRDEGRPAAPAASGSTTTTVTTTTAVEEDQGELLDLESFASALLDEGPGPGVDADVGSPELPLDDIDPVIHYQIASPPPDEKDAQREPRVAPEEQEQVEATASTDEDEDKQLPQPQEDESDRPMRALLWFRRDLRVHDNLALHAALRQLEAHPCAGKSELISLYTAKRPQIMLCAANRFQFMLESVAGVMEAFEARGSRLLVARGDGEQVLRRVLPAWGITHLFFDAASEPFALARDDRVVDMAQRLGVRVEVSRGYMLYDLNAVLACNHGKPPKTYTAFLRTLALFPPPAKPLPVPETLPPLAQSPQELYQEVVDYWSQPPNNPENDVDNEDDPTALIETLAGPDKTFGLPQLTEFGYEPQQRHPFLYGGEQRALCILDAYCASEARVVRFEKPKTSPAETQPSASTTSLSPFLYFGCLSAREFYYRVREIQSRHVGAASAPPVSLDGQLLWREFFHCQGRANPYFDKMEENPICLQIDWRWHDIPKREEDMTVDDKLAKSQFEAWRDGQTGFPWIDAIMVQLREEGWMHHLARHSVACFLTRGDLYISWVRGLEVFQERLIDHDWNINAGNWLWLSSSAFFTAYFRVYSPSTFGRKWDPDGNFIRKYVPVLANMPAKYIYEPWKAPVAVQRTAGCLVGKHYPFPIVDHKIALRRCIGGMKASYAANKYGELPTNPTEGDPGSPRTKRPRENSGSSEGSESDGGSAGGSASNE